MHIFTGSHRLLNTDQEEYIYTHTLDMLCKSTIHIHLYIYYIRAYMVFQWYICDHVFKLFILWLSAISNTIVNKDTFVRARLPFSSSTFFGGNPSLFWKLHHHGSEAPAQTSKFPKKSDSTDEPWISVSNRFSWYVLKYGRSCGFPG